jgi:hypothetical protein
MNQSIHNNTCPDCKGKCCRDLDLGYKVGHMGAAFYEHTCDACVDGTKYIQPASRSNDLTLMSLLSAICTDELLCKAGGDFLTSVGGGL